MIVQQFERQCRLARAEAAVSLLKGNDVWLYLVNDRQDLFWSPQTVSADGLSDVVTGNPDHGCYASDFLSDGQARAQKSCSGRISASP